MKTNGIWIDYSNKKQVAWWNKIASRLVRVVRYDTIVETATGKPVGVLFSISGPFMKYVMKKNLKFVKDPVTAVFETKE